MQPGVAALDVGESASAKRASPWSTGKSPRCNPSCCVWRPRCRLRTASFINAFIPRSPSERVDESRWPPSVAAFYGSVSARVGALQRPDGCVDVTEKSVLDGSVRDGMLRLGARQVEQPRRARSSPRRIVSTDTERTDQERSIRSEAQMGNAPHRTYTLRQARHDHALWFSANAMKLHGTRIHEERAVSGGDAVFVVTSEKPPNHVRTWSVRLFTREVSGTIGPSASVGWGSHAQALAVATRLAAEETK